MIVAIIISVAIAAIIAWFWADGIDKMKQNHPDYKGEDWLNWDDNKNHTESNF
jgi:Na+/citrate or Na+/malate symporter